MEEIASPYRGCYIIHYVIHVGVLSQCERDRVKIDQEIMSLKKQLEETSKLN